MTCPSAKHAWFSAGALLCVMAVVLAAGCSRSSQESQVSGNVSLDGQQIGPGIIVFAPVDHGTPAIGPIDGDGSYSMSTSHEVGLSAGKYKVGISIREMPTNVKRGDRLPPGKLLIPERYEDSATSGLEFDVAPGTNTIDIELKSQSSNAAAFWTSLRISHSGFKPAPSGNVVGGNTAEAHEQMTSISA
jgi:hypothetical protein